MRVPQPLETLKDRFDRATDRPAADTASQDMEWFGVRNLVRAAKGMNLATEGRTLLYRRRLYRTRYEELFGDEQGAVELRDGWALDTSCSDPHLERLLAAGESIIAARGDRGPGRNPSRAFIRDIAKHQDATTYPALLDFITSPRIVAAVARYLGHIPVLSTTVPPGIRLTESSIDGQLGSTYQTSQLYHLDFHDTKLVYVIVLLRDTTIRSGPFTFIGAEASARVAKSTRYLARGVPYRLADEQVYDLIEPQDEHVMSYPKGTILLLDSSRCLHFGSRDAVEPRYQLMYAYVSPARADFTLRRMTPRVYPVAETDAPLRRLLLDRHHRL